MLFLLCFIFLFVLLFGFFFGREVVCFFVLFFLFPGALYVVQVIELACFSCLPLAKVILPCNNFAYTCSQGILDRVYQDGSQPATENTNISLSAVKKLYSIT